MTLTAALTLGCLRSRNPTTVADLIGQFSEARKQPGDAAFEISDVTIDGRSMRSIVARDQTRLTYHVTIPNHATLDLALAVHPNMWNESGGAILFIVGISDGNWYQTKASIVLDPLRAADRRWHRVAVNLEEFAGLTVDIVLNTRVATASDMKGRSYLAVWGAPAVTLR